MQEKIFQTAKRLGLNLTIAQCGQIEAYLMLLNKWNAAYNLSAIKDIETMLVKHVYDCMAVVSPIYEQLIHNLPTDEKAVLDVGSGAGLPGIVLAVCLPDVQVTMLDAVQKKMLFVRQAIAELKLTNAQAHGTRIQDWAQQYPVVTARAWTALADIPTLAGHCVKAGGAILAMKGPRIESEAQSLPLDWVLEKVLDISVPNLNEPRTLAYLRRKTAFPA